MIITLGIIEDQQVIRDALCSYLSEPPDMDCVLSAGSVEEFAEKLVGLSTKLALLPSDISLLGLSGIEGLALWRQYPPEAAVVMLSIYIDADRVFEALHAGAIGYLHKMTPLPMLAELLRQVAAGGSPMSPSVARHVIRYLWPARRRYYPHAPRERYRARHRGWLELQDDS